MMNKELTIILPTLNSEKYLVSFFKELSNQTYKSFCIYICDGGSKDKTIEIINKNKFDLKIISRKDKSFEDGVNKCLRKVKTEYFCIFGSDDKLGNKHYLNNLIQILKKKNYDIIFPNFGIIKNNQKKIFTQKKSFDQILYKTVLPGIGWIAKKKVIKKNKFNLKYKVASDYDLLLKFYKNNFHFYRIYNSIYYFRLGVGTSFKLAKLGFKEQKDIALINNGPKLKIFYIYILYNIKYFLKYKLLKYFI